MPRRSRPGCSPIRPGPVFLRCFGGVVVPSYVHRPRRCLSVSTAGWLCPASLAAASKLIVRAGPVPSQVRQRLGVLWLGATRRRKGARTRPEPFRLVAVPARSPAGGATILIHSPACAASLGSPGGQSRSTRMGVRLPGCAVLDPGRACRPSGLSRHMNRRRVTSPLAMSLPSQRATWSPMPKYSWGASPVSTMVTMKWSSPSHPVPSPLLVTRALKNWLP